MRFTVLGVFFSSKKYISYLKRDDHYDLHSNIPYPKTNTPFISHENVNQFHIAGHSLLHCYLLLSYTNSTNSVV